jgi:predicted MFS family arabinose efflux permease
MDSLNAMLVLAVAALISTIRMADLVTRFALYGEIMPPGQLMGAMGLSRATTDSARIAGALAGAGMAVAFGMGPAYAVIAAFYAASAALTLTGLAGQAHVATPAASAAAPLRELREALAYVWRRPPQLACMAFAFLVNLTAFPFFLGLLPFVAKEVYGAGQTALGWMAAAFAFGSLVGSLLLSATRIGARTERVMVAAGILWHALLFAFALTGGMAAGVPLLVLCGVAQSVAVTPIAVVMLRHADEDYRGRVMGLRMLAIYGLPLGLLAAGPLIGRFGFAATAMAYALTGILATLWMLMHWHGTLWNPGQPPKPR